MHEQPTNEHPISCSHPAPPSVPKPANSASEPVPLPSLGDVEPASAAERSPSQGGTLGRAATASPMQALGALAPAVAYTRWDMQVISFGCADLPISQPQADLWDRVVDDTVNWCNGQLGRAATNLGVTQDHGARSFVRSDRPLSWFRQAHEEVIQWWAQYPRFATSDDVKEYRNTPASRQRWWMNALCDLARFRSLHLGGSFIVQPVPGDVGKAMRVHTRTVVLCTFACPPSNPGGLDGGAVAPATTAMISPDALLVPGSAGAAVPPAASAVIGHEFLHTLELPHPDWEHRQPEMVGGRDVDIMAGGMYLGLKTAVMSNVDLVRLRDKWASEYHSQRAVHTITMNWLGSQMPDGDIVQLSAQSEACPPDRVRLTIELNGGITWWKGLHLFDRATGAERVLGETQDSQGAKGSEISLVELKTNDLVLAKAKFAGIHTHMYCLQDADRVLRGGTAYTFRWIKD